MYMANNWLEMVGKWPFIIHKFWASGCSLLVGQKRAKNVLTQYKDGPTLWIFDEFEFQVHMLSNIDPKAPSGKEYNPHLVLLPQVLQMCL